MAIGRRRLLAALLAVPFGLTAAGCGFALRRSAALPFPTLYVAASSHSQLAAEFRRMVQGNAATVLAADPASAAARLEVLSETREKEIVGYSSTGRPREYQLRLRARFRVAERSGRELLPPTELMVRRDITTTDLQLVAKEQEEELLYREMQSDIVQQMLRRLAALQP